MNARDAIRTSIETADMISKAYLEDLTDDEMMHRPHEKCNHIKWQLGHLIASDYIMVNGCCPGAIPALPDGFVDKYGKETCTSDNAGDFHSKSELLELWSMQRAAALIKLSELSDDELNAEAPEAIRSYAPNFGAAFGMLGIHWTMHSGQWAVICRQLGREPVM